MSKSSTLYKSVPNQQSRNDPSGKGKKPSSDIKSGRMRKREGVRQYSIYLRESTHRDTKIALLMRGVKQDFSGLVEELLTDFLAKHRQDAKNLYFD